MPEERDVIEVLTHDHREVLDWFDEYGESTDDDRKQQLVTNIIIELVRHSEAEEQLVYPVARRVIPDGSEIISRELSEHSEAERMMNRLDGMKPGDDGFDDLVGELGALIRQHVEEEESGWFPQLREHLDAGQLTKLGSAVEAAKRISPTRPHPLSPDHPPLNVLLGPGAGVVDRVRDLLTGRKQTD